MAELFDDVAEESEPEEEEVAAAGAAVKKRKPAAGSDSSDESDDEGQNEYDRTDGFLVDSASEGGSEGGSDEEGQPKKKKKKKRKREREIALDDEDYELLAEAGIHRAKPQERRRIRKKVDGDAAAPRTAEELRAELFGGDEEGLEDEVDEPGISGGERGRGIGAVTGREAGGGDMDDEYDMDDDDDFIDDDIGDGPRRPRRRRMSGAPEGVSSRAVEEAQSIFGDASDLLRIYEASKASKAAQQGGLGGADEDEEEGYDEAELLEMSDEEMADQLRQQKEDRRRERLLKKATGAINPELLKRHHLLPEDQIIRETDLPEREQEALAQLRGEPFDAEACAEWVYERMFQTWTVQDRPDGDRGPSERVISRFEAETVADGVMEVEGLPPDGRAKWRGPDREREGELKGDLTELGSRRGVRRRRSEREAEKWQRDPDAQQRVRAAIRQVLTHLWSKHEEVPLVALHRKEVCGELLAMRRDDAPDTTTRDEEDDRRQKDLPEFSHGTVQPHKRRMRRWDVLWGVHAWSLRWWRVQRLRSQHRRQVEANLAAARSEEEKEALRACLDTLAEAQTEEALDDVARQLNLARQLSIATRTASEALESLTLENGENGEGEGEGDNPAAAKAKAKAKKQRQPQRTTKYGICHRAGLLRMTRDVLLSPEQLSENLEVGYRRHSPSDPRVVPLESAVQYVNEACGMPGPEDVLQAAVHMAACDLAAAPGVCRLLREVYQQYAVISTDATPQGDKVLEPFHQYGPVRRLRFKPAPLFLDNDQFLRIALAEKEGLLTSRVELPEAVVEDRVLARLRDAYLSPAVSDVSREWNELRQMVLNDALQKHLLPFMEVELRKRMVADAREAMLRDTGSQLWRYCVQAPLRVESANAEEDEVLEPKIMAVVWGPGDPATTFVMLDAQGNMVDFLPCAHYSGRQSRPARLPDGTPADPFSDPRKSKDAHRVLSFIKSHLPHVLVVGTGSSDARQLKADMEAVRDHILTNEATLMAAIETGNLDVRFADETLPAVWEKSAAAADELKDASSTVKRAVALGRMLIDPLALLASLCGPGREVLSLSLHPLQTAASKEDRMEVVQRTLVTAACQVGVDINVASRVPWAAPPLQFLAGLGPRKAPALIKAVQRAQQNVDGRVAVWQDLGVIGKLVFKNCAAFLRFPAGASYHEEQLDSTRVHPINYSTAVELATAAMAHSRRPARSNPVGEAMDSRNRWTVEKADLVALDYQMQERRRQQLREEAEERGEDPEAAAASVHSMLPTLIDIQFELLMPYGELREDLGPPREEDLFWMLTGLEPGSLRKGQRVEVVVRWVGATEARCQLTEPQLPGVDAMLRSENISASHQELRDARDLLKPNMVLTARVLEVKPREFSVELSTRSDHLNDDLTWEAEVCGRDEPFYYVPTPEEVRRAELDAKRSRKQKDVVPRPIVHPYYRNSSMAEVAELFKHQEEGECIFYPGKDMQHLRLSIKLLSQQDAGGECPIIHHISITEASKGSARSTQAMARLGTPLTIDWWDLCSAGDKKKKAREEKYEDLDEVVARFVEPYVERVREVTGHRKFKHGSWETIKEELLQEKRRGPPSQAVYCVAYNTAQEKGSGYFYIGHIINTTPRREYFTISPDGVYFRSKTFTGGIEAALQAWKKQPIPPQVRQQQQAAANAMTPGRGGYGMAAQATPRGHQAAAYGHQPFGGGGGRPAGPFGGGGVGGGIMAYGAGGGGNGAGMPVPQHRGAGAGAGGYAPPPPQQQQQQAAYAQGGYGGAPPPPPQGYGGGGGGVQYNAGGGGGGAPYDPGQPRGAYAASGVAPGGGGAPYDPGQPGAGYAAASGVPGPGGVVPPPPPQGGPPPPPPPPQGYGGGPGPGQQQYQQGQPGVPPPPPAGNPSGWGGDGHGPLPPPPQQLV